MVNRLTPDYLSDLAPNHVGELTTYNLRNSQNFRNINCNTQLFSKSFLPSTVHLWNNLPPDTRNSESLNIFKRKINTEQEQVPSYYLTGPRDICIYHTRLRTHCSKLNEHLHSKNIIDSHCVSVVTLKQQHITFSAAPYSPQHRTILINNISTITVPSLSILLEGSTRLQH